MSSLESGKRPISDANKSKRPNNTKEQESDTRKVK